MNILRSTLITLLLCSTTAFAEPASESSLKQLLVVTQAEKLVEGIQNQLDSLMNSSVQQALREEAPTPKQEQAIANMKNKMVAIVQAELAWEKLEPFYLRLYKESFSEDEVTAMLAFYKTQAGQAVIHKMPVLMQKTMIEVQRMSSGMIPKIQTVQQQFSADMASASK